MSDIGSSSAPDSGPALRRADAVPGLDEERHRCPGERVAVELIKSAAVAFSGQRYDVPAQDLTIPLSRMPTEPRDGLIVRRRLESA